MSSDKPNEEKVFTVRAGTGGEAIVTSPSGRVEFMGLWKYFKFVVLAFRAGHKIKVQND